MTRQRHWTHLPQPIETGEHASPRNIQLAEEINADIEAVERQRKWCDNAEESKSTASITTDPAKYSDEVRELRLGQIEAWRAEARLREKYTAWLELNREDVHKAIDRWASELPAAIEEAKEALRGAGFRDFVDRTFSDFFQADNHKSRLLWVVNSYGPVAELHSKIEQARHEGRGFVGDLSENRRLMNQVKAQAVKSIEAMATVV